MEEGELSDSAFNDLSTFQHDPAFEWPGDEDISHVAGVSTPSLPLRLIVLRTSILHKHLRVAVLDAYGETQFGRDNAPVGSEIPRIRLKEMQVSKLHATAYWDKQRREWAVVDMGSKHGTFLQSGGRPHTKPTRISPPRMGSIPRALHHLDQLIIGSTTFLCHLHADRRPCVECVSNGQDEIPLFPIPKDGHRVSGKRTSESAILVSPANEGRDPKKALTTLRRALLSRLGQFDPKSPSTQPTVRYVDRSARRRAMNPGSHYDSPGVQTPRSSSTGSLKSSHESAQPSATRLPAVHVEQPQTPCLLMEQNVGRQLLMKQGWQPGTALGTPADEDGKDALRLMDPLEPTRLPPRAGLGAHEQPVRPRHSYHEWNEASRERRWQGVSVDRGQ